MNGWNEDTLIELQIGCKELMMDLKFVLESNDPSLSSSNADDLESVKANISMALDTLNAITIDPDAIERKEDRFQPGE